MHQLQCLLIPLTLAIYSSYKNNNKTTAGRHQSCPKEPPPPASFLAFPCTPRFGVKGQQHDEPTRGAGGGPSFQFESICIPFISQDQERRGGGGGCIEN